MTPILLDIPFNLIQQVRLAHALTESDFTIVIPLSESLKFSLLRENLSMSFKIGDEGCKFSKYIKICHSQPLTKIGNLYRPLIFPHAITKYCQTLWREKRGFKYSFVGLITKNRRELLNNWIKTNVSNKNFNIPWHGSIRSRINQWLYSIIKHDDTKKRVINNLLLWSSMKGRRFPIKAWDDNYFNVLANSEFVLCPSGDYTWSYRFFESILCGAIPIVEQSCSCYEGFRFLKFDDKAKDVTWSESDAVHNYQLCINRITLPCDELNRELRNILAKI